MTSHLDHMDFFLTSKDGLIKDDFILNAVSLVLYSPEKHTYVT